MNIKQLKFRGDDFNQYKHLLKNSGSASETVRNRLLSNSLKITKELTPKLFKIVSNIEKKLKIDISIECYVRNHTDANANCFAINNNKNLIMTLTSGLINIMSEDELSFVIGHEIGHYLFGHLQYIGDKDNLELAEYSQAQEISADRVGFICSKNINTSIKAIIKVISGLGDFFISNNFHTFLHQHNKISDQEANLLNLSHPLLPTRAKSLMLFSMSELYYNWKNNQKEAPISTQELENNIQHYLNNTSLKPLKENYSHIASNFKMWALAKIFTDSNNFGQDEIAILYKEIGKEKTINLEKYILDSDTNKINEKYNKSLFEFMKLPAKYKNELIKNMGKSMDNHPCINLIKAVIYDSKKT